MKVGANLR
jgi:hypothetical protein